MTFKSRNRAIARIVEGRDLWAPDIQLFAATLLMVAAAVFASASLRAETTSEDSSASQVFELPEHAGSGEGKEVSVLLDESHLKLAILTLRRGTTLPAHSAPVPTTIQVLEGNGVIHVGTKPISVSAGTLVSLVAGEAHGVVPKSGSDMLLLVHYLRGDAGNTAAAGDSQ